MTSILIGIISCFFIFIFFSYLRAGSQWWHTKDGDGGPAGFLADHSASRLCTFACSVFCQPCFSLYIAGVLSALIIIMSVGVKCISKYRMFMVILTGGKLTSIYFANMNLFNLPVPSSSRRGGDWVKVVEGGYFSPLRDWLLLTLYTMLFSYGYNVFFFGINKWYINLKIHKTMSYKKTNKIFWNVSVSKFLFVDKQQKKDSYF